jgi:hypothetical protein
MSHLIFKHENENGVKVYNRKKEFLGEITWYADWDEFVFEPEISMIFSGSCLHEIIETMKTLG